MSLFPNFLNWLNCWASTWRLLDRFAALYWFKYFKIRAAFGTFFFFETTSEKPLCLSKLSVIGWPYTSLRVMTLRVFRYQQLICVPLTIDRIALSVDYTLLQKQDRQKQIAKSYSCRALWIAWIQRALDLLLGKYSKVFFFLPREITSPLTLDRVMSALSKGNFPLTGMRIIKKKNESAAWRFKAQTLLPAP